MPRVLPTLKSGYNGVGNGGGVDCAGGEGVCGGGWVEKAWSQEEPRLG